MRGISNGVKKEDQKKLIKYWQETAEHDHETMEALFKIKRYSDSLFFGHIVLEKILKALIAKNTKEHAPFTHNLVRLAEISKVKFTLEEADLLKKVSKFNIEARYPEQKLKFYNICTKDYTAEHVKEINELYKNLCQELKLKR